MQKIQQRYLAGDEVEIEAICEEYLLGEVYEKFGKKVEINPINKNQFRMKLSVNPFGFKLWALRNLDIVTVTKPNSLVKEIKNIIEDANKRYK